MNDVDEKGPEALMWGAAMFLLVVIVWAGFLGNCGR